MLGEVGQIRKQSSNIESLVSSGLACHVWPCKVKPASSKGGAQKGRCRFWARHVLGPKCWSPELSAFRFHPKLICVSDSPGVCSWNFGGVRSAWAPKNKFGYLVMLQRTFFCFVLSLGSLYFFILFACCFLFCVPRWSRPKSVTAKGGRGKGGQVQSRSGQSWS